MFVFGIIPLIVIVVYFLNPFTFFVSGNELSFVFIIISCFKKSLFKFGSLFNPFVCPVLLITKDYGHNIISCMTIDHLSLTAMAKPKPQSLFLNRVSHYWSLTSFLLTKPNCFKINSFGDLFDEKFTMDFSSSVFEQNLKLVYCQARVIFVNEQRTKNLIIPLQ